MDLVDAPPGYRSAVEYYFRDEHAGLIVRIAAYHRKDHDLAVISFPLVDEELAISISAPFNRPSTHGLGVLERLPTELLCDVILRLDMQSLFRLRQTNARARQIMDALHEYRLVASYGLTTFCALLRTGLAGGVSLSDFYDALCTKNCSICGGFGGFMSLPTWTRCCFVCLQEAPQIQIRSLARVRKQLRLPRHLLNSLPKLKTLPGHYFLSHEKYVLRVWTVSLHQAKLLSAQHSQGQAQAQPRWVDVYTDRKYNLMGSCALPYYDKGMGQVEEGLSCAGCQLVLENTDWRSGNWLWAWSVRDKVYSKAGFLEHFKWCEHAQRLWRMSEEGTRMPAQLPLLARTGEIPGHKD